MNQFEGTLWTQVYANYIKEFHNPVDAQATADEAVKRLRESDVALDRRVPEQQPELQEGQEVGQVDA